MQDSIPHGALPSGWQEDNGIIVPTHEESTLPTAAIHDQLQQAKQKKENSAISTHKVVKIEVPQYLAYPYDPRGKEAIAEQKILEEEEISVGDSIEAQPDTIVEGEVKEGIVLVNPASEYMQDAVSSPNDDTGGISGGMSWIYLLLGLLFCVAGVRFKGSSRYMKALMSDLTDTRVRHNAFDDTVRETSLLVLLNLMWAASAGVLLWKMIRLGISMQPMGASFGISDTPSQGIAVCMGVAAVYLLVMNVAYWVVGNVFSDAKLTRLWIKGSGASIAMQTFVMFPLALLALTYSDWVNTLLIIAGGTFLIGKIVFLYKGFRIFFSQISSWFLFLYYLCSLEIVPLILTYAAALWMCSILL